MNLDEGKSKIRSAGLPYFTLMTISESRSVMSNSLWPHELYNTWNSPGQNTGVGSLSLLQGIFPTQGSSPGLPHCRRILYQLSFMGSSRILEWITYSFSRDLRDPGIEPGSPALQADSLPTELLGTMNQALILSGNHSILSLIHPRFFLRWVFPISSSPSSSLQPFLSSSFSADNLTCYFIQRVKQEFPQTSTLKSTLRPAPLVMLPLLLSPEIN